MTRPFFNKGLSILEVTMAASITGVIFAAFFSLISICATAAEHSIHTIAADVEADRNVDRLVREILIAVTETITEPIADSVSTVLIYQKRVGLDETTDPPTLVLSTPFEIKRVQEPPRITSGGTSLQEILDNGMDDDDDGFIDEGNVIIRSGSRNIDIITRVTKLEFRRDSKPSINITLEKVLLDPLDRDPVTHLPRVRTITVTRRVFLANNQPVLSTTTTEGQ